MERAVKVYQILFILWAIVFAFWVVRQFADHNKRKEKK
jgi:flagellar biogenesis protein FliO